MMRRCCKLEMLLVGDGAPTEEGHEIDIPRRALRMVYGRLRGSAAATSDNATRQWKILLTVDRSRPSKLGRRKLKVVHAEKEPGVTNWCFSLRWW